MPEDALGEVASPCVMTCRIIPGQDYCNGCWRTLDEISGWHRYSAAQKRAVLAALAARRAAAPSH